MSSKLEPEGVLTKENKVLCLLKKPSRFIRTKLNEYKTRKEAAAKQIEEIDKTCSKVAEALKESIDEMEIEDMAKEVLKLVAALKIHTNRVETKVDNILNQLKEGKDR